MFYYTAGAGCTAFDVVVHPTFLEKMKTSEVFKAFFISITMEGIQEKYDVKLKRGNWNVIIISVNLTERTIGKVISPSFGPL